MFVFTYGNPEVKWQRNAVFKMPRLHRIQNFFTKITSAGSRVGLQSHLLDVTVLAGVWSYGWTPVLDCPTKPVFERTFADEAPGSAGWVGEEPAPPPAVQVTSGSEANKDKFFEIWPFQPFITFIRVSRLTDWPAILKLNLKSDEEHCKEKKNARLSKWVPQKCERQCQGQDLESPSIYFHVD